MIISTGIDIIEIERFAHWHTYSAKQLRKLFSEEEIEYCLSDIQKSAQRFAVRFALREALFKSIRVGFQECIAPFLTICKAVCLEQAPQTPPKISVNWKFLQIANAPTIHISLSHSKTCAMAQVILEK